MKAHILSAVLLGAVSTIGGCASDDTATGEDELRAPTAVVELSVTADGTCAMRSTTPRVKFERVVRLKNVGDQPIAALVELWDNTFGMPAPEGGDIAPGAFLSVKMNTRWWVLNSEPESHEWTTPIVCKKGPWSSEVDMEEVGVVNVFR